jgi:hypothetical protein
VAFAVTGIASGVYTVQAIPGNAALSVSPASGDTIAAANVGTATSGDVAVGVKSLMAPAWPSAGFTITQLTGAPEYVAVAGSYVPDGADKNGKGIWLNSTTSLAASWDSVNSRWQVTFDGSTDAWSTDGATGVDFVNPVGGTYTASPGIGSIAINYAMPAVDPNGTDPPGTQAIAVADPATSAQATEILAAITSDPLGVITALVAAGMLVECQSDSSSSGEYVPQYQFTAKALSLQPINIIDIQSGTTVINSN